MALDKPSILVVEDVESNLDILVDILSPYYDVSVAIDGPSAIEITQKQNFKIILLDIVMPGMNGFDVCEKIKNNPKTKDCPVIFVSANSLEEDREKGFSVGAVGFVSKPYQPNEVLLKVKKFILLEKNKL